MVTATKPLMALTAADLMTEALVIIPQEMSLRAAAHLLSMHQISGAPVVDDNGQCVGVLSAMDFVHWAEKESAAPRRRGSSAEYCQTWQIVEPESLPREAVINFMTEDPVIVSPTVHLAELARMMVDAHIHRIIVVDGQGRPRGIVSSIDLLAAVAYAHPSMARPEPMKGADE
jgi:CBS domain-containing protein